MRRSALLLLLLPLTFALAACGDDGAKTTAAAPPAPSTTANAPAPLPANPFEGRTFVSQKVTGHRLVPGTEIALTFAGGLLSAQAGCNSIRAPYAVDGHTLKLTQRPATTAMHCEQIRQDQDEWLTSFLKGGVTFEAAGDVLTLTGRDATIRVVEGRPHGTPPPVTGTKWVLDRMGDGTTNAPIPAGVKPPTLRMTEGGDAKVFAGCNSGGGTVKVGDDGFLTFGPIGLTRMLCDEAANTLEHTVTSILDGRVAFAYEGDDLVIAKNGSHLTYRAD